MLLPTSISASSTLRILCVLRIYVSSFSSAYILNHLCDRQAVNANPRIGAVKIIIHQFPGIFIDTHDSRGRKACENQIAMYRQATQIQWPCGGFAPVAKKRNTHFPQGTYSTPENQGFDTRHSFDVDSANLFPAGQVILANDRAVGIVDIDHAGFFHDQVVRMLQIVIADDNGAAGEIGYHAL